MGTLEEIIGQDKIKEHIESAITGKKVSHAYILSGEEYCGKKMVAQAFAQALLCEHPLESGDSCNQCTSCVKAQNHNHPDIIWVTHEKETFISVDEIRNQVVLDMDIKPYESKYKIYIIPDADKMNPQAQNAILKTIEEPPEYGIILLLASNTGKFLSTIMSRCVELPLKPLKDDVIALYLQTKFGIDVEKSQFAAAFSMGNMGKAIRMASVEEFQQMKADCIKMLTYIYDMEIYEIIMNIKEMTKYKLVINDFIDIMMMWYRDILMLKVTKNPNRLIFKEEYGILVKQAEKVSFEGIDRIMKAMDVCKVRINAKVNLEVALELLLFVIKEN